MKLSPKNFQFYLILLIILFIIKCDTPAHCPSNKVAGTWKFSLYGGFFRPAILDDRSTCGHGYPGKIFELKENEEEKISSKDITEQFELELSIKDFNVYQGKKIVGKWTNVYDQLFLIYYQDFVISAQLKYYVSSFGGYQSDCSKTMTGWLTMTNDEDLSSKVMSCFVAEKIDKKENEVNLKMNSHSFLSLKQNEENQSFLREKKNNYYGIDKIKLFKNVKMSDLEELVKEINDANLSWKAKIPSGFKDKTLFDYLSQIGLIKKNDLIYEEKENNNFDNEQTKNAVKSFIEEQIKVFKEIKQKKSNLDILKNIVVNEEVKKENKNEEVKNNIIANDTLREKDSEYVKDPEEILKYFDTPLEEIDENVLPKNWDWRNVGGENYYSEEIPQGSCGGCFAVCTISILESRLRIKTLNKDQTKFSLQFPLSCSYYTEGCDGGYPIMLGKFFNDFELVPRECFEYAQNDKNCEKVCDYEKYKKKYRVTDFGYIGGYYGAGNEALMIKELRARGPITGNFLVPLGFALYDGGIYSSHELIQNSGSISYDTLIDKGEYFEELTHSVTILGYGEENGIKYWICMNSWGTSFGENGYFKILRGVDERGIESMPEFFNIEILDREN